ncbi:MAG: hypothetical protein JXB85_06795 [Anaerolineales bacterium]|nr:hypothetical protein [Anaerolineales bacterium]
MPEIIDYETMYVDDLPPIWSPVQWELSEEERIRALEDQARASLLWAAGAPEAILRLLLNETALERLFSPPEAYDPAQQGDWDNELITFGFVRPFRLDSISREADRLELVYKAGELGYWRFEIDEESVLIERI